MSYKHRMNTVLTVYELYHFLFIDISLVGNENEMRAGIDVISLTKLSDCK